MSVADDIEQIFLDYQVASHFPLTSSPSQLALVHEDAPEIILMFRPFADETVLVLQAPDEHYVRQDRGQVLRLGRQLQASRPHFHGPSRVVGRTPSASRRHPFFALSGEVRFVFTPVLKRSPTTTSGSAPAAQWGQRRRREALAFWTEDRPHSSTTPHTSSRKKASDVL